MRDFLSNAIIGLGFFTFVLMIFISVSQGVGGVLSMIVFVVLSSFIVAVAKQLLRVFDR